MRCAGALALALVALASVVACETPSDPSSNLSKDEIVERARSDLTLKRLALFQEPTLIGVEAVQLPSGSLGCPTSLPWASYPSDLEWGYRILLGLGGEVYEYRAGQDGRVVTCGEPRSVAKASEIAPTPTPTSDRFVEAARRSLSVDLRTDVGEVALVDAQPGRWEDFSLGCPQPGKVYPRVEATGYSVWLRARGQTYELRVSSLTGSVEYCARDVPPTPTATPPPIREPVAIPTPTPAPRASPLSGSSLDRVLQEVAAERNVSIGDIQVESVEPVETSRWREQCRRYTGATELRGSVAELSVHGGMLAVYLAPDGGFVRCGE